MRKIFDVYEWKLLLNEILKHLKPDLQVATATSRSFRITQQSMLKNSYLSSFLFHAQKIKETRFEEFRSNGLEIEQLWANFSFVQPHCLSDFSRFFMWAFRFCTHKNMRGNQRGLVRRLILHRLMETETEHCQPHQVKPKWKIDFNRGEKLQHYANCGFPFRLLEMIAHGDRKPRVGVIVNKQQNEASWSAVYSFGWIIFRNSLESWLSCATESSKSYSGVTTLDPHETVDRMSRSLRHTYWIYNHGHEVFGLVNDRPLFRFPRSNMELVETWLSDFNCFQLDNPSLPIFQRAGFIHSSLPHLNHQRYGLENEEMKREWREQNKSDSLHLWIRLCGWFYVLVIVVDHPFIQLLF